MRLTTLSFFCSTKQLSFFLYDLLRVKITSLLLHHCNSCVFLNSLPLSLSMPFIWNGKFCLTSSTASFTHRWALFKRARFSVQPEWTSVRVIVQIYCPWVLMPQLATVSTLKKLRLAKPVYVHPNRKRCGLEWAYWDFLQAVLLKYRGWNVLESPAWESCRLSRLICCSILLSVVYHSRTFEQSNRYYPEWAARAVLNISTSKKSTTGWRALVRLDRSIFHTCAFYVSL